MGDSVIPPRLLPGDTVAVCAPAGVVEADRLDAGLKILSERYQLAMRRDAVLRRDGFLAGSDEQRADCLNRAIRDPDVRAIFVARGGYGITRIVDLLDAGALRADPKPIVGFSDATALLCWAMAKAGVRGIHGPVVTQLGELAAEDHARLFELLESEQPCGVVATGVARMGGHGAGVADGPLIGGNLCLLSHLVGTGLLPVLDGAIVLIEDVGERPYAIDRYLTHLGSASRLSDASAVVVGDFVGCEESKIQGSPDAMEVIVERLNHLGLPAVRVPGVGHGKANRALPFGARVTIDFEQGTVSIDQPAVASS